MKILSISKTKAREISAKHFNNAATIDQINAAIRLTVRNRTGAIVSTNKSGKPGFPPPVALRGWLDSRPFIVLFDATEVAKGNLKPITFYLDVDHTFDRRVKRGQWTPLK